MNRETENYTNKTKDLQRVDAEINRINKSFKEQRKTASDVADFFTKWYGAFTMLSAAISGINNMFSKIREQAAKMSDVYADVQKTTGMTADEVKALNEEFKKMDTRTSREELNALARDAGKLGIAKEDVLGFVEAGNQINVALGEDLGDDAIKNIGKIITVFKTSQQDLQAMDLKNQMLSVGSAINSLGQSSTASEQYLVDFAQRLGGVAAQAGISIQNILGYASALDQSGQAVEMSATALQKFIMNLLGEPEKFARIAGLEVKQFNELLATDTNQAIKTVLTSLQQKGGFQELIPIFKEMGLDGARAVGVLSSLATNIEAVETAQRISNEEFTKAISLTNEYGIRNETMQAKIDKARKKVADLREEIGNKLQGVMLKTSKIGMDLINLLVSTPKEIYILIAALVAVQVRTVALTALTKTWTAVVNTATVAKKGLTAALYLFTGSTTKAKDAWKGLNTAMKANFIILAAAAVYGLVKGLISLVSHTDKATEAQEKLKKKLEEIRNIMNNITDLDKTAKILGQLNKRQTEDLKTSAEAELAKLEDVEMKFLASQKAKSNARTKEIAEMKVSDAKKAFYYTQENHRLEEAFQKETGINYEQYKEQKKKLKNTISIAKERIAQLEKLENNGTSTESDIDEKDLEERFKKMLAKLEQQQREERNLQTQAYIQGKIDREEYYASLEAIDYFALTKRKALYESFGKDTSEIDAQIAGVWIKIMEDAREKAQEVDKEFKKWAEKAKKETDLTKETENIEKDVSNDLEADFLEKVKAAEKLKEELHNQNIFNRMQTELDALDELHRLGLISEEEYEKKKRQIIMSSYKEIYDYYSSTFSNMISAMQNAEVAKVEADEQKKLAALQQRRDQGLIAEEEYNTEKEKIENEAAQKKLDIEKKYADVNFAIKVSEIIANTASAIMTAYSQLGPIAGSIAAVMLGVTGAMQIAAANAERQKVKSMTLDSAGSSTTTQQRVVLPGAEKGGYAEVERKQDGKLFKAKKRKQRGYADSPTVLIGEAGAEFVANADAVANPTIKPVLDLINIAQQNGSVSSINLPKIISSAYSVRGFESGGYTSTQPATVPVAAADSSEVIRVMKDVSNLLNYLKTNGVDAWVVLSQLQKQQALLEKSEKLGSRK